MGLPAAPHVTVLTPSGPQESPSATCELCVGKAALQPRLQEVAPKPSPTEMDPLCSVLSVKYQWSQRCLPPKRWLCLAKPRVKALPEAQHHQRHRQHKPTGAKKSKGW